MRSLFAEVFGGPCQAIETAISYEASNLFVDFDITTKTEDLDEVIRDAVAARRAQIEQNASVSSVVDKRRIGELEAALSVARTENDDIRRIGLGIHDEMSAIRAQFSTLLENLPIAAYIKDRDGQYVTVNPTFEKLFGLRKDELLGLVPYDIHPFQVARDARAHDLSVLRSGETSEIRQKVDLPIGSRSCLIRKFPIWNGAQIIGLCALIEEDLS